MGKRKTIGFCLVVIIIGFFAYTHIVRNSFSEKGTLMFNGPADAKAASLWKQYKESDGTVQNKESKIGYALVFDEYSQCAEGIKTVPCESMASVPAFPFANHTVTVEGIRQADEYSILVRRIIKL